MIAFETLLLGIVIGRGPVRLMVAPPVTSVEIRLDRATVVLLHRPPWATNCDFGPNLLPHQLTAVGFDAAGHEVGRVTQWVNLGRERGKVSALLERDPKTRRPAALSVAWNVTDAAEPQRVVATLDGAPLPVTNPHRIPLPELDLAQAHLVSVEVTFTGTLRGRADLALGGDVIESAESELTAVAVTLPARQEALDLRSLNGVFLLNSAPIQPVAVDEGRAEAVLVFDSGTRLVARQGFKELRGGTDAMDPAFDRVSVASSIPTQTIDQEGGFRDLFGVSTPMRLDRLGNQVVFMSGAAPTTSLRDEKVADAVAVAGAEAAASNHRRGVVLVLSEAGLKATVGNRVHDRSTLGIPAVKAYLAALNVPLFVWSLIGQVSGQLPSAWGPAADVSTPHRLRKARNNLERQLASQRIVWFAGRHLPQSITLDETATRIRLAR